MPVLIQPKRIERVQPNRCMECNTIPVPCPTCADYQCQCIVPWLAKKLKKKKILIRVHYDKTGRKYESVLPDEDYPDEEEDIRWIIGMES